MKRLVSFAALAAMLTLTLPGMAQAQGQPPAGGPPAGGGQAPAGGGRGGRGAPPVAINSNPTIAGQPFPTSAGIRRVGYSQRTTTTPTGDRINAMTNSDLAFWGQYAFQGSYDGFRVIDIADPKNPKQVAQVQCAGTQGDVIVWNKILIRTTDQARGIPNNDLKRACEPGTPAGESPVTFRGLQIFQADDWTKLTIDNLVTAVKVDCGAHTATMVPDLARNRLIVYSAGGCGGAPRGLRVPGTVPAPEPPGRIIAIEIPIDTPSAARVVNNNIIVGGGCHDLFVSLPFHRLVGACSPKALVFDITDPVNPKQIMELTHPDINGWHSAALSYDGKIIALGTEPGGGTQPRCMATGTPIPNGRPGEFQTEAMKAIFMFDAESGKFINWHILPRPQTAIEACTIHNYAFIPVPGRRLLVHGSYQSGTAVVDMTDPMKPKELVWADPQPGQGRVWGSYYYGGYIYESDMFNGLDVYQVDPTVFTGALNVPHLNPQTAEMIVY